MSSHSKYQKIEGDRISNLPTSLISHILSSLPTKYAVRTSSMSTFWYQRWTSITQLNFDDTLAPEATTPDMKASFLAFVYRVLLHLKVGCLDVFQLNCSQDYGVKHVNSWVSAALSRQVQHLDLSFSTVEPVSLPRSLYFSKNLVVLKLGLGFLLIVPISISLDYLKILHLSVKFSDNDSLSRLVSSCPVLGELKLRRILGNNVNKIQISSASLERLILIGLNPLSEPQSHSYRVVLNTPCLQYLEYLDSRFPDSFSIGIHCLDIARIDVGRSFKLLQPIDIVDLRCNRRALALFADRIFNSKFLHLSKDACHLGNFRYRYSNRPTFPCLIELELHEAHGGLLSTFLERSPKLTTLTFQSYEYAIWQEFPPVSVPLCMSSSLKKIEIKNFRGQDYELDMVRYFLENSKCLNKFLISYPLWVTKEKDAEISKKLLMLPRASTSCVVIIT